jgi:hypothetical protein
VRTFFSASDVKGKCPLPVTASPKRKKGMIKLQGMESAISIESKQRKTGKVSSAPGSWKSNEMYMQPVVLDTLDLKHTL